MNRSPTASKRRRRAGFRSLLGTALMYALAYVSFGLSRLIPARVESRRSVGLVLPKMLAHALSPAIAAAGATVAALGLARKRPGLVIAGVMSAVTSGRYMARVTRSGADLSQFFGPNWEERIPPERATAMLKRRWVGFLPRSPEPRFEQNVAFGAIAGAASPGVPPDGERKLLCDIWQPPEGVTPTGLAYIYLHGSAWHYLDKDYYTRPIFKHLAAQGHVIMDVAYRLCPETDLRGMEGDARRAIAWMKQNAAIYGVDPQKIVVAGGSAGGHLALLAAYSPDDPELTPEDLKGKDLSVRAVVSIYGPADLLTLYEWHAALLPREEAGEQDDFLTKQLSHLGVGLWNTVMGSRGGPTYSTLDIFDNLLGGSPDEVPEMYELGSPTCHVHPGCPPTLIFQGAHDTLVPPEGPRWLYLQLTGAGVPVAYVEYPDTEHAFDLVAPEVSPVAQSTLYDLERFLALLAVEPAPQPEPRAGTEATEATKKGAHKTSKRKLAPTESHQITAQERETVPAGRA